MNVIELAMQAGFVEYELDDGTTEAFDKRYAKLVALVEAAARADERELIKKAVEELNPVENNPLLQNKPASFWIENFRQIVYARGTT